MTSHEDIATARKRPGRRLALQRLTAGLNQHQLAPLTCYARRTAANVESDGSG